MPDLFNDPLHWQNCKPPLAPNQQEVELYKYFIGDSSPVCLLGMTKDLISLCDLAVDTCPVEISKPTIKCDWNELSGNYGVIIGDGVLNLAGMGLVERMLEISDKFIARVFMKKQPGMKYAKLFYTEFPGSKEVVVTQKDVVMVMWERD